MASYGLATIFESFPEGHEFSPDNLPLHLTHIDSFRSDINDLKLQEALSTALKDQKRITLQTLSDTYYGPDKDVLVTEVELSPELAELHAKLVNSMQGLGVIFKNPQFLNEGNKPHVSVYGEKRVQPNQTITIKEVSLVKKLSDEDGSKRRLLLTIVLG